MPRSLTFSFQDHRFNAELHKVDRSQLYGSVSVVTDTLDGDRCTVATLASDGKTLIPKGGTALGYVNPDGEWVTRDQLNPVDLDGNPIAEVESSFDETIALDNIATTEAFLDHNVRLVYRLDSSSMPDNWLAALQKGDIFRFGFSYRGGVGHDPAFILCDESENVWLMITQPNDVHSVGLEQAAVCKGEPLEDDDDDSTIDFSML